MTKITRKTIMVIAILVVIILIASRIYIESNIVNTNTILSDYNARKEDLIVKQQQLQIQINNLNVSLQQEVAKQKNLTNQITALKGQPNNPSTQVNQVSSSAPASSPPPASSPAPSPPPTPTPPPVTRAS